MQMWSPYSFSNFALKKIYRGGEIMLSIQGEDQFQRSSENVLELLLANFNGDHAYVIVGIGFLIII